jgi:hypothetical protein
MAQHDLNIANQSFPSFRTDLNNALSAIQTTHSGTSTPTGAVAGQIWLDTTSATTPTLKYYDGTDNISLATIDHSANTVNWLDSTVSVTGLTTTATGTVLTLNDTNLNSTVSIRIPTTKGIDDDSGNEFLKFTKTASAVNEFTIINSATGSAPEIQSTGDDTNIDLKITPKGSGKIILDGLAFPNADGTANQVLQTNGSGVLSFATPSGGKVLQVVSSTYSTQVTTTSNTHVTSNLSVSITPSSTSSKILVLASAVIANDNNNCHVGVTLYRGATNLSNDTDMAHSYGSAVGSVRSNIGLNYLDSPSTTSSTTYAVYFRAGLSGNTQYIHINDSMSVITAIEIAG